MNIPFFVFCFLFLHIRPVSVLLSYCLLFNAWTGFPVHHDFLDACLSRIVYLLLLY